MDIQAIIDGLTPKDYRKEFDPEDRIEFDKRYPNADEKLAFLASHKALPYQNDVESFENPDFFTRIRRDALGIFTGPERALLQKQKRLLQDQYEPIQQARQKVGTALMLELAAAPQKKGEFPAVDKMLGFGESATPTNSLQAAPTMGGDPAMAGMPLGASSANAAQQPVIQGSGPISYVDAAGQPLSPGKASMNYGPNTLSDGGRLMTPDALAAAPMPQAPMAGVPGTPNPINYGSGFDYQGRPVAPPPAPALPTQPIRPEPIADPMQRQPMAAPAPQDLSIPQRLQAARALTAQAGGHLMPDETGKLVPASFMAPESRLLSAPQQQELASIYNGGTPSGQVKLPAAPLMQALKGKQDKTLQGLSAPIKDYLQAKGLEPTPANIDQARSATRTEKIDDEKSAIEFKESLQAGSQKTRDFLYSKTGKAFLTKATPQEVEQAIKDATNNDISEHARKAMDSFKLGGLDGGEKEKLAGLQQILHVTDRLKNEFTPAERREFVGYFQLPVNRLSQIIQANPRFAKFDALVNREGIAAFETGGKALTAQEAAIIFGFLPNAKEWSPENFEAKLLEADDYGRSKIHTIVDIATTNRRDMGKKMEEAMPKASAAPSAVKSDEDYNKLPSGTLFISPDGKTRRKP